MITAKFVIPAKAGIQVLSASAWIPAPQGYFLRGAFAGMTVPPGTLPITIENGDGAMDAITYNAVRSSLASAMDRVCNDHCPLVVTHQGKPSVVMLSLEDYKALEETTYLLRSPANAKRLISAAIQLGKSKRSPDAA